MPPCFAALNDNSIYTSFLSFCCLLKVTNLFKSQRKKNLNIHNQQNKCKDLHAHIIIIEHQSLDYRSCIGTYCEFLRTNKEFIET